MTAQELTLFLYNLTLIPITFFSLLFIMFSMLHLLLPEQKTRYAKPKRYPFITVQVPSFNDPIAARCVKKCLQFDYPNFEIHIVDDSTNKETQQLLKALAAQHKKVRYIHRNNRAGYKPGALKNAMKYVKGEIMVLFDADWIPRKDFLKTVVRPFNDENVAIVQTRQGFYNHKTNLISRFAAYTLLIYHTIVMPINHRANCVFFCGTAGAIRTSAFKAVGGWNTHSLTEDADLTVRLLMKGYKTVYVNYSTPSEVPFTFEGFIKQQMRWCYGNVRVFIDNIAAVMYKRGLTLKQRGMITYITLGNIIAPVVVLMTVFGLSGWFVGDPTLMQLEDLATLIGKFMLTVGFLVLGLVTLYKHNMVDEFKYLALSAFTIGLVLAVANSIALLRAVGNRELNWFCTPKTDNMKVVDDH